MDIRKTDTDRSSLTAHHTIIGSHLPQWLASASTDTYKALRKATGKAGSPAWLEAARLAMPDVLAQLDNQYTEHRQHQQRIAPHLERLENLEDFAASRLQLAIKANFGIDLNVRDTYLFHASHAQTDDSFAGVAKDPMVAANGALRAATRSLLEAALQNFSESETRPGALDKDSRLKAEVFATYQILGPHIRGTPLAIAPHEFATLVRRLDLGGRYQTLIDSLFDTKASEDFQAFECSALLLEVHLARLKGLIDQASHTAMTDLLHQRPTAQPFKCSLLRLWDVELTGIMVFGHDRDSASSPQPVLVYIPEDPVAPLQRYDSAQAFHNVLRERMFGRGYLEFFSRFIPARQRSQLMQKLQEHLYPKVKKGPWHGRRWLEQEADRNARLRLEEVRLATAPIRTLYLRKLAMIKDNARFQGVSTAEQDQRSLEQRLLWWRDAALNALNVGAFVLPVLGEVMLLVTAAQLSYEVFEGIEDWAQGEREQGMAYLLDVAQNIAQIAALGAVGSHAVGIPAIEAPALADSLRAVRLPNGQTRLWKPDLAPFAHDIVLPAELKPDSLGLYQYQGKQWLPLEGHTYSVKTGAAGDYVMQHPSKLHGYEPPLRHNGAGAWLHVLDEPRQMPGLQLLRRLGYDTTRYSDAMAERILKTSGIADTQLRKVLSELEPVPALLADTAWRFRLDQELGLSGQREHFNLLYQSLQTSHVAGVEQLQQALPVRLPRLVAEELVRQASPAERRQLHKRNSVPARLVEEARLYSQQIRLARAYEGLYLESVHNSDTDRLILHSLEGLPGWSGDVRLEVREEFFSGALLDSIGRQDAPIRKVLIKTTVENQSGYMARDAEGRHLNGRADLYASILHALPDAQRQALGIPNTGQRADLQRAIEQRPLLRRRLRDALGMHSSKPGFRSPMRLADGRIGYPLSGRAGSIWTVTRESLLNKLSLLEFEHAWPDETLERLLAARMSFEAIDLRLDSLLAEREALSSALSNWGEQAGAADTARSNSRQRISTAIWRQWGLSSLPEIAGQVEPLNLHEIAVEDFPAQLPAFFYQRVTGLQLDNLLPSPTAAQHPQYLINSQALEHLLWRFGNAQSLHLAQSRSFGTSWHQPGLLQRIAGALPNLTDLSVINHQLWLDQAEMDGLRNVPGLRSLNLSGNRFNQHASLQLDWLRPQRLVLEHADLRHWPAWLDTRLPGPIREVSLANNRLTELPAYILDNPLSPGNQSVIDVRGNPLAASSLLRARLDETLPDRSFRFLVDTPPALELNLQVLASERDELTEAIAGWSEASTSQAPPSTQIFANRQRVGQALMEHWRAYARGETQTPLHLESVDLADFPARLPNFLYMRVRSLRLNQVSATSGQLDRMLRMFTSLTSLRINGAATSLLEPPAALLDLPSLNSLSLTDLGLSIDRRWADFLGRLPQLQQLELDGNPLGSAQDISSLGILSLRWLSLRNTGLRTWPAWVLDLLPTPLETLILDNNQLTEIPEELLANPRSQWGHSEISLRGNPLAHHAMLQAHTSQRYGRSYSFEMDLPEDIRQATWYESHDSDSTMDDSDTPYHVHSPATSSSVEESNIDPWLLEQDPHASTRFTTWQLLREEDDAHDLLDLMGYLQRSADYRNPASRPQLIERVWQVLAMAAEDPEVRVTLDGIAEEPLQLIRSDNTCPDGIMLEFNQMEVLVFTRQTLREIPDAERGSALFALTRRLYRLHELDRIAREQANGRDEAEVRLAYRLHWAQVLDLPVPPQRMLYEAHARLQPGELDTALSRVQAGERGDAFVEFATTQAHWVSYLREKHARGFEVLKLTYQDNLNRLTERYDQQGLSLSSPQFESEARQLEQEYQEDQLALLRALTTEASMNGELNPDIRQR